MAKELGFINHDMWDEFSKFVLGIELKYTDKDAVIKFNEMILQGKNFTNSDVNELVRKMFNGNRAAYAVLMRYWKIQALKKFIPDYFQSLNKKNKILRKADDISVLKYMTKKLDRFLRKGLLNFNIDEIGGGIIAKRIKWDIADAVRQIEGNKLKKRKVVLIEQDREFRNGKVEAFDSEASGVSVDAAKREFIFDLIGEYILINKERFKERNFYLLMDVFSVDKNGLFTGVYSSFSEVANNIGVFKSTVSSIYIDFVKWIKDKKGILIERKRLGKEIIISRINDKAVEDDNAMLSKRQKLEISKDRIMEVNVVDGADLQLMFNNYYIFEYKRRFKRNLLIRNRSAIRSKGEGILEENGQLKDLKTVMDVLTPNFYNKQNTDGNLRNLFAQTKLISSKLEPHISRRVYFAYYFDYISDEVWLQYISRKKPKTDFTDEQKVKAKKLFHFNFSLENERRKKDGLSGIFNNQNQLKTLNVFLEIASFIFLQRSSGENGLHQIKGWLGKIDSKERKIEILRKLLYDLGFVSEEVWRKYLDTKKPRTEFTAQQRIEVEKAIRGFLNMLDKKNTADGGESILNAKGQIKTLKLLKENFIFNVFERYVGKNKVKIFYNWFRTASMKPDEGAQIIHYIAMKLGFIPQDVWDEYLDDIAGIKFLINNASKLIKYEQKINNNELFTDDDLHVLLTETFLGNKAAYEILMKYWGVSSFTNLYSKIL